MKKIKTAAIAAAISLACATSIKAGESPEAATLQKVLAEKQKIATGSSTDDPKWRASLATALHGYCESVPSAGAAQYARRGSMA